MDKFLDLIVQQAKEIDTLYSIIDSMVQSFNNVNSDMMDKFVEMLDNVNDNVERINTRLTTQDLDIRENNKNQVKKQENLRDEINKVLRGDENKYEKMRNDLVNKISNIKQNSTDNLRNMKLLKIKVDKNNINKELIDDINKLRNNQDKYETSLSKYDNEVKSLRNEMRLSRREKFKEKQEQKIGNGIKIIK